MNLNNVNTNGRMTVRQTLISQTIGGVFFSLLSGQPLVILMTTAPLSLYIKVIYSISVQWETDFGAMYAWVGLFNALFLIIYSTCNASRIMRWCTRSTEEIFSLFITVAFFIDAGKDAYHNFQKYVHILGVLTSAFRIRSGPPSRDSLLSSSAPSQVWPCPLQARLPSVEALERKI